MLVLGLLTLCYGAYTMIETLFWMVTRLLDPLLCVMYNGAYIASYKLCWHMEIEEIHEDLLMYYFVSSYL